MKNAWAKYTVYRLGLFVLLTVVLRATGIPWIFSVLLAAMLSFAFSVFFLSKLRDELSRQVHERRTNSLGSGDPESDLENDLIDKLESDSKKSPTKRDSE
jgi:hypothetical protein